MTDTEDGDINRALTSSFHGRIVALNDVNSTGKTWSTIQYNIAGMPDFTTADGSLEEGFLPYWDGKSPSAYFETGHINLSLTEDGRIDTWPTSGLLSDFDGKENTAYADSSAIIYGACGQAAAYSISGISNITADQMKNAPAYNVAGQKVGAGFKGIVIKNGKKVIVK